MITLDFGQECVRVLLRSRINYHFHAFPFLAFPGSHQCWLTSPCSLARNYPTGRRIPPVVAVIKLYQHRPLQPERAPLRCFETPPHPDLSQHCLTYPTLLLPHPSAALLNTALLSLSSTYSIHFALPHHNLLRFAVSHFALVIFIHLVFLCPRSLDMFSRLSRAFSMVKLKPRFGASLGMT